MTEHLQRKDLEKKTKEELIDMLIELNSDVCLNEECGKFDNRD